MTAELSKTELGTLGETLVANWLQTQGWRQCDRQWHCRWGELDLIVAKGPASRDGQLAFVEVKTRSQGNWDAYGLMAITRSKQAKLWKAAQLYLLQHPQWAEAACRFDVALVACRHQAGGTPLTSANSARQMRLDDRRYLVLQDYIDNAFDGHSR
ncbi:YraN family protein [Nodosilinea sp. LEGE 06152]|uniref:YraN family protein n=1 Tax=Nodosilinea sp. LEGE 06152 TaxID=2777966 RepID=UPI001880DDAB|nr:YraN family protein [Nodosilinea sp. LEGE 06152]MBE9156790.1 YraN family protein [Nodosilinea sp. LEGE 06152]